MTFWQWRAHCATILLLFILNSTRADVTFEVGGGRYLPVGDSARHTESGVVFRQSEGGHLHAGFELSGENLGLQIIGAYYRADRTARASGSVEDARDVGNIEVYEAHVAPKLYLARELIGLYALVGAGRCWIRRETTAAAPGGVGRSLEADWSARAGLGLELPVSDNIRIGFAPTYHLTGLGGTERMHFFALTVYAKL